MKSAAPHRTPQRGEVETAVFREAMLNELACNAHKGPWTEIDTPTAVHEVLYHAVKLALALQANEEAGEYPEAVLEYAADVALGAMFAAHASGALDTHFIRGGHAEDYPAPWRRKLPGWKSRTRWLTREVLDSAPALNLRRWVKQLPRAVRRGL